MSKGFTLVELLVVMGIILILVSIAIPTVNVARNKAKDMEVRSGINQIQTALEQYATTHTSSYPGAHWEEDTNGVFYVGPGVLGGVPTYDGSSPHKDFYVAKNAADPRGPYLTDGTPNPQSLDSLVVEGFLTDYPPNPFLKATDGNKAQMSNLFLFNPILGDTTPIMGRYDTLNWNRYTNVQSGSDARNPGVTTMRKTYMDFGRGHFSYIPLNPVNNTGYDYEGLWTNTSASNGEPYNDLQRSGYYKRCRSYMLIGWGHNRLEDGQAKGVSEKYWNSTEGGFDFDNNLMIDGLEQTLTAGTLMEPELRDSDNDSGAFGGTLMGGGPDIDPAFFGATVVLIPGS
ncbi:type II secretion system protein [bacterium]|nr:type II secretion system protein [bacterium]